MNSELKRSVKIIQIARFIFLIIWLILISTAIACYLLWPENFTAANIAEFLRRFDDEVLVLYFTLSIFRGFTLVPSTPLVIAGTLLFPQQPWPVLAVSLFGIAVSSSMIYWFSDLLGISEFFETRKPKHVQKIRARLEHPTGLFFVFLWAFFPLVPTDAVCYVAGTMKMNFPKFICAVLFGELILCSIYIFFGGHVWLHWN